MHFLKTMVNGSEPVLDPFFGEARLMDPNQLWTHFWRTMVNKSEPVGDPFFGNHGYEPPKNHPDNQSGVFGAVSNGRPKTVTTQA
jgi:hypothetical protein